MEKTSRGRSRARGQSRASGQGGVREQNRAGRQIGVGVREQNRAGRQIEGGVREQNRVGGQSAGANFLVQGSILAIAGIIVRLIGMVYRIPLANMIGDEGNGYYGAAYNIYATLLIMSSYSLPVAVSKMVASRLAVRQYRNSIRILKAALLYATVAGGICFCLMWFGADFFADRMLKMPYCRFALRALAPTVWIMAYLGVLRGYFQGHSTMVPTAFSQIVEQIVNAAVSLLAAGTLFSLGLKSNLVYGVTEYSYAFGAVGATMGTGAGALAALLCFLFLMARQRPVISRQLRSDRSGRPESYRTISSIMAMTILPILVSSTIYNSGTVIDNVIFGQVMAGAGAEEEIASQWGIYSGRYHLLFNIPVAIANALSSSLIPSLSMAMAEKNRRQVVTRIAMAVRFSMIIAIPAAVGMTVLAGPIARLLFPSLDNTMLISMLQLGSAAVVVFSLSTVTNGVLQGINRMRSPIINASVAMVLHIAILYVMLGVFHMGIFGVLWANILFALLVCIFNAVSIARYVRYRQEIVRTFLIPLAASAVMGGAAVGVYRLCAQAAGNLISTAAAVGCAVVIYFLLLLLMRGVNEQELKKMPGGTRLLALARLLHLM